jgi:hypothetical protein
MLAALVEKVRTRDDEDEFHRPNENIEPREPGKFKWVDVD